MLTALDPPRPVLAPAICVCSNSVCPRLGVVTSHGSCFLLFEIKSLWPCGRKEIRGSPAKHLLNLLKLGDTERFNNAEGI